MRRFLLLVCGLLLPLAAAQRRQPVKLKAGMVTGIDQVGLPIALERGFFEKQGLDVAIARPYATGVDALNALQAGESEIVQVGVPMIGAVLRGMDLVALGNYSGNATKLGSDATMAIIAGKDSGIAKGDLKSLKGKKIAASFGTINHLYILAVLEKAGLTPDRRDAGEYAAAGDDGGAAGQGHRRVLVLGPLADRGAEGRARCGGSDPRRRYHRLSRLQRRPAPVGGEERRDHREIPRRRFGSRQVDARQPEAGRAGGDALDSGPQGRHRRSGDGVQHPAGRPAAFGQQLPGAVERAGQAAAGSA